jgi:hypothetical protein
MIDIENLPKIGERSAEDILELLARPFKPEVIRSRRIGGKDVRYLPITAVVERLNKSCNVWSFRILDREMITMLLNRWDDQAKNRSRERRWCSPWLANLQSPNSAHVAVSESRRSTPAPARIFLKERQPMR